jgi:ATP-dependent DNA ligase
LCSIFSRNSEDLSKKYPDILAKLDTWIKPGISSFVLDCESVAWDVENKKVLPFQQLMTRKRKDVKAEDVKVKVCVFAFDLLFLNGEVSITILVHYSNTDKKDSQQSRRPCESVVSFCTTRSSLSRANSH